MSWLVYSFYFHIQLSEVLQRCSLLQSHVFILIHSFDGPSLRSSRVLEYLRQGYIVYLINSQIASLPMVHVLASIDHIRGNLLLSSGSFASFNFVFIDATTFEPYFYEKMFMSQVSQAYRYPTFIWYILVANQLRESHMFSVHSLGII